MKQESVAFTSLGEKIVGTLSLPDAGKPVPCVIICHGAFDYKEHYEELAASLAANEIAALSLDMHGHGASAGRRYHVRMEEWTADLFAAHELLSQHPAILSEAIGGFGFSSGGTAVLEAAVRHLPWKALVTLDATVRSVVKWYEAPALHLASLLGKVKQKLGAGELHVPMDFALKVVPAAVDVRANATIVGDPYLQDAYARMPFPGAMESFIVDTIKRVEQIKCPVCVIHGADDKVDSPKSAHLLFERLRGEKALHVIPDSGHVGLMDANKDQIMNITTRWFKNKLLDNQ